MRASNNYPPLWEGTGPRPAEIRHPLPWEGISHSWLQR